MSVTIYHNPRCSKSRQTLELLRENGVEPEIVEYLDTPPAVDELTRILGMLGVAAKEIVRGKEAGEEGVDAAALDEQALVRAIHEHPRIMQRPIVVSGDKAAMGRPPECVLEIL